MEQLPTCAQIPLLNFRHQRFQVLGLIIRYLLLYQPYVNRDHCDLHRLLVHLVVCSVLICDSRVTMNTNQFIITQVFPLFCCTVTGVNTCSPRVCMVVTVSANISKRRIVGINTSINNTNDFSCTFTCRSCCCSFPYRRCFDERWDRRQ